MAQLHILVRVKEKRQGSQGMKQHCNCNNLSQPAVPLSPSIHVPPTLRAGECYHVFISYSSTDYQWTHSLINQLESCGLQVCYHERDFTPGRTVLENMSDCILESQKVLLVLSPEFVRSRWCLLEANMSLFLICRKGYLFCFSSLDFTY
uniref:TIR domain-containing protein n=1 Tax=Dicentrarchus labrax TaxID=13489 RepID=A0A8C4IFV0_DICLA